MEILCFALGLAAEALAVFIAYKKRHDAGKCIAAITLGIIFATFFWVLPTQWIAEGEVYSHSSFYVLLSSLFYGMKSVGGGQDMTQLETMALPAVLKSVYIIINYINFALAPILASSLILSFVGDTGEKIRFWLQFTPKCYVFSEVNERAIILAQGIKKQDGKKTLVFCNTKDADKELVAQAKKLGAIMLYQSAVNLKLSHRFQEYEFYFLSESEDHNLGLTELMISQKEKLAKHKITVNSFVQNGTNIEVLESMMAKTPCAVFESTHEKLLKKAATIRSQAPKTQLVFFNVSEEDVAFEAFRKNNPLLAYESRWQDARVDDCFDRYDMTLYTLPEDPEEEVEEQGLGCRDNRLVTQWQEQPLKIRFVDEIALFCNNLLYKHPLYDLPDGRKDISVLLVGCGKLGMQMLKTVVWCGQIPGHTLKIRVLDKHAAEIEKTFYSHYPEMDQYDIRFVEADVESVDFEKTVKACKDATFVCVALESDELNVATAENVYRILHRNYSGYTPPIFSRVRKRIKTENLTEKGSFLGDRKIDLVGTTASVFSNETLFNTELENLAFAVHLCYWGALEEEKDSFNYQKALNEFYTSEYSRRSSMATALHIPAKLTSCRLLTPGNTLPTEEELAAYEDLVKDGSVVLNLSQNEHDRWNAFVRSEGFRTVDFETVKKYAPITRSHKDETAKLHPCIVSWEELDILQEQYDALQQELNLKPNDFKKSDRKIVTKLPQIVRKARALSKEGW